jgi:GntR family transcriptional regulator, transcriptional repressor for pyruvate dehydrogenase complex
VIVLARPGLPIVYSPGGDFAGLGEDGRPPSVRPPKTSELVAARIVRDIVDGHFGVGDRLRSEARMIEHYEVSRESLREALRILEVQGLITIRRGANGGPVVSVVNASYLARTATLYFNLVNATYANVFGVWSELETAVAGTVARLDDPEQKSRALAPFLAPGASAASETETFLRNNSFHSVLADLAGNPVLTLITQAISHIVVDHVVEATNPVQEIPALTEDHHEIAQAIVSGRVGAATRLMRTHTGSVIEHYRARWPDRLDAPIRWR